MPFIDEEVRKWHEDRRGRSQPLEPASGHGSPAGNTCLHCGRNFSYGEGVITPEASICYICND